MNLQTRVERLEEAQTAKDMAAWELALTRLTEAEVIELEACYRKAVAAAELVQNYITPELEPRLRGRVKVLKPRYLVRARGNVRF